MGAMGSVTHVICRQGRKDIEVILVKFDSENVGINAKEIVLIKTQIVQVYP